MPVFHTAKRGSSATRDLVRASHIPTAARHREMRQHAITELKHSVRRIAV